MRHVLAASGIVMALSLPAVAGSDITITESRYMQPSPAICDAWKTVKGALLCAIRPSRLDSSARDEYDNSSAADLTQGFGYHAILFPPTDSGVEGVYVHFVGTYDRPYDQRMGSFAPNEAFLSENVNSRFVIILPAYDNRFAVTDICEDYLDVDNCAGLVRKEKITGRNVFPYAETPLADSIEERIRKLASYFDSQGVTLPKRLAESGRVRWNRLRVGGHSQGAGMAYFLAKNKGVAHACFLAGPYDIPDLVEPQQGLLIADWYLTPKQATPVIVMKAALAAGDASYNEFVYAYDVIGLIRNLQWFRVESPTGIYRDSAGKEINAHGAIMRDPQFSNARRRICFE